MDNNYHENHSNNEPNSSLESTKKTRGPTTCKKLREKIAQKYMDRTIEFDELGNPIGKWKDEFTSYIGAAVRVQVDINIESWNIVSEGLKQTIWEDIKNEWNIKDDAQKRRMMTSLGKLWKDFKSRLVNRYLLKDKNPCEKYDYISKEQWEKFKTIHQSNEFKERSDKARESQKCNKHPHFLGKGGYAAKRAKWLIEDPITSLPADSNERSIISDDRSSDWIRARTKKKDEGGYYIPKEDTREVFQKMGAWQEKVVEGTWSPHGHDDILTRALERKEHGGRVRGVGGRALITNVFGSEKRKEHSGVVSIDELATITKNIEAKVTEKIEAEITKRVREEYKDEMNEMNMKLRGIFDHFIQMGMPLPVNSFGIEINTPQNLVGSSCQSVDPDTFTDVKKPTPCHLCVMDSNSERVIVARGTIFPSICQGKSLVHGEQMASSNVKVSVDDVDAEFQHTPLPVSCAEHKRVGDAHGSFVQWPKNLIIMEQDSILVEKKKDLKTTQKVSQKQIQVPSKGSTTHIQKNEGFLVGGVKLQNLSDKCQYLHNMIVTLSSSLKAIEVVKDQEVFRHNMNKEEPIYVLHEDVADLLRMGWLNIPVVQIFMMYIHKLCKESNIDLFRFMCPSQLALVREHTDMTITYMTNILLDSQSVRFILAPYFQDQHWMLLVICCHENAVYLFDPMKKKRNIRLKGPLGVAFRVYVVQGGKKNKGNKLNWFEDDVQCPQQKGGTECCYYIMRYMYEILTTLLKNPKANWTESIAGTRSYTQKQIDEIRDIWAEYFLNECI